jgi:hypothetical protein
MSNIIRATLILASVIFFQNVASAQDAGTAPSGAGLESTVESTPVGACFAACERLYEHVLASQDEGETPPSNDEIYRQCINEVPECSMLNGGELGSLSSLCDRMHTARHRHGALPYETAPAPPRTATPEPGFCVLPDGTDSDHARHRCGCPAGLYPLRVARERSIDRLRSIGAPPHSAIFVCYNPLAPSGAPGSGDERWQALETTLTQVEDALTRLCVPHESEALPDACARAREEFLAAGSSSGPVDLEPLRHAITDLEEANRRQDEDLAGLHHDLDAQRDSINATNQAIGTLSGRVDTLLECLVGGSDHQVTYTDSTGHTQTYSCPDILAHATRGALDQAREQAHAAAREEIARAMSQYGHAFAMLQAYGLVEFNPLTYGNTSVGNLWQFGGELTLGVALGQGWNFHGGMHLGYGGPDIHGVTNVAGGMHIGIGDFVIPELMIGGGFAMTHRFTPDVFSAESLYGGYLSATIRFMPNSEWSPVLTVRVMAGGSPRQHGSGWGIDPNGAIEAAIGVAHF